MYQEWILRLHFTLRTWRSWVRTMLKSLQILSQSSVPSTSLQWRKRKTGKLLRIQCLYQLLVKKRKDKTNNNLETGTDHGVCLFFSYERRKQKWEDYYRHT